MAEKEQIGLILLKNRAPAAPLPVLTLFFLVLSICATAFPQLHSLWILDRYAVVQGELWRVLSCHLVHFTPTHLVYNVLVFAVAGWLVERTSRVLFFSLYITAATVVSVALLLSYPAMHYYGGLSGVACGFVLYSAFLLLNQPGPWQRAGWIMVIGLPVKVILEFITQDSILPYPGEQEFITMPLSHLAGMGGAALCAVAERVIRSEEQRIKFRQRVH